jgi:hypothetical protein
VIGSWMGDERCRGVLMDECVVLMNDDECV